MSLERGDVIPTGYESERVLGSIMMRSMVIQMNDRQLQALAQLQAFLDGTAAVDFARAAAERYGFIARTVRRFAYGRLKRAQKAVVLRFLERVSGCSCQQRTRLVKRGAERTPLQKRCRGSRTSFPSVYTLADVLLLAHTDSLYGTLSGPATKKLMERAWSLFGDLRCGGHLRADQRGVSDPGFWRRCC